MDPLPQVLESHRLAPAFSDANVCLNHREMAKMAENGALGTRRGGSDELAQTVNGSLSQRWEYTILALLFN